LETGTHRFSRIEIPDGYCSLVHCSLVSVTGSIYSGSLFIDTFDTDSIKERKSVFTKTKLASIVDVFGSINIWRSAHNLGNSTFLIQ